MLKCEESRKRRTAYVFIQIPENVRVRFLAMIVVTKKKAGCFVLLCFVLAMSDIWFSLISFVPLYTICSKWNIPFIICLD